MWMRGGTSKGGYFLAIRPAGGPGQTGCVFCSASWGLPIRQIDGMGGADPLTSKVAVVRSVRATGVDVDYLFLQVFVDRPIVTDAQNCGNILAGVGPFAIERGLVAAHDGETPVRIFMENTGQVAEARIETPDGRVRYGGDAQIDGVPGGAAPIPIAFRDTAGSSCGALLPTGNALDRVEDVDVTMIDNGMPCVVMRAADLGIEGDETPEALEANIALRGRLESIRLACGPRMNLGNVTEKTVPKLTMASRPRQGGAIATRTFIPHRCHKTIGVLGAVSVATACLLEGSPAHALAETGTGDERRLSIEHPTGEMTVIARLDAAGAVESAAILRTARKLMDGTVY